MIPSFIIAGLNCVGVSEKAPEEIETIEVVYDFSEPRIEKVDEEYYSIGMENTQKYYDRAGLPLIPFRTTMITIPQGRDVETINVVPKKKVDIEGRFKIEYARQQTPIQSDPTVETGLDNEVYSSAKPFPGELYSVVSTQYQRGSEILILNLYPVEYIPISGRISYYEKMIIVITTVPAS
jgi:hypothetical protein